MSESVSPLPTRWRLATSVAFVLAAVVAFAAFLVLSRVIEPEPAAAPSFQVGECVLLEGGSELAAAPCTAASAVYLVVLRDELCAASGTDYTVWTTDGDAAGHRLCLEPNLTVGECYSGEGLAMAVTDCSDGAASFRVVDRADGAATADCVAGATPRVYPEPAPVAYCLQPVSR